MEDAKDLTDRLVSDTTARSRRDEWIKYEVLHKLLEKAINAYDEIIDLDFSEVSVDASLHKNHSGGGGTGKNPTDKSKFEWRWSITTDTNGIPIGWTRNR